jgi:hypothetical protein
LHSPDASTTQNLPAKRETPRHNVLDDNRLPASQGLRRLESSLVQKPQKPFVKSALRLDLKITGCPTHELDIAKN